MSELTLETFVDTLLKEKGVAVEDVEVQTQLKADLLSRVEDRVNAEMLAALPPEHLEAFEKLVSDAGSTADQSVAFLKEKITDYSEVLARTLLAFRTAYLSLG